MLFTLKKLKFCLKFIFLSITGSYCASLLTVYSCLCSISSFLYVYFIERNQVNAQENHVENEVASPA